jgi:O-methyltransferase
VNGEEKQTGVRTVVPNDNWLSGEVAAPRELYLDLLKRCLTGGLYDKTLRVVKPKRTLKRVLFKPLLKALASRQITLVRLKTLEPGVLGGFPRSGEHAQLAFQTETLVGYSGLDNLHYCIDDIIRNQVPGDLIETGVLRGGATIFMRAALKAYGDTKRIVWAADSFQGGPEPDPERHATDLGDTHWSTDDRWAVPLEEVKRNFVRYGVLDDQVRFLVGWFHETLPSAPLERLALIRLDADMYGSTMDALNNLYPKLSVGGYLIVDDYWLPKCKAAVDDYRAEHGITEEIVRVNEAIVFWQRLR